jgi:acetyl esterase/lipase
MKPISILKLLVFTMFFSCIPRNKGHKPVDFPKDYSAQIDMVFKKVDTWEGRIDLYINPTSKEATPIVLNIHGGGWSHGKKESQTDFDQFFKNGYAVANVNYRLVDVAPAPAAIEDLRCALIYLYNNAKDLNIDTNKIVIKGESAGGHLALMTGLLGDNTQFDTDCNYNNKLKIAAIISKYSITDLETLTQTKFVANWLGNQFKNQEFIKSVSPIHYVSKDSPPVFIAHGDADELVPFSQSEKLYKELKKHNVITEFLTIPNAGHGRFTKKQNKLFNDNMWLFLNKLNLSDI